MLANLMTTNGIGPQMTMGEMPSFEMFSNPDNYNFNHMGGMQIAKPAAPQTPVLVAVVEKPHIVQKPVQHVV